MTRTYKLYNENELIIKTNSMFEVQTAISNIFGCTLTLYCNDTLFATIPRNDSVVSKIHDELIETYLRGEAP